MSPTSYQAAPPRAIDTTRLASVLQILRCPLSMQFDGRGVIRLDLRENPMLGDESAGQLARRATRGLLPAASLLRDLPLLCNGTDMKAHGPYSWFHLGARLHRGQMYRREGLWESPRDYRKRFASHSPELTKNRDPADLHRMRRRAASAQPYRSARLASRRSRLVRLPVGGILWNCAES
jgi:hypothetical protein